MNNTNKLSKDQIDEVFTKAKLLLKELADSEVLVIDVFLEHLKKFDECYFQLERSSLSEDEREDLSELSDIRDEIVNNANDSLFELMDRYSEKMDGVDSIYYSNWRTVCEIQKKLQSYELEYVKQLEKNMGCSLQQLYDDVKAKSKAAIEIINNPDNYSEEQVEKARDFMVMCYGDDESLWFQDE